MTYVIKEFLYITFKCITHSRIILALLVKHFCYLLNSLMASFSNSARERVGYKHVFKQWIKNAKDSMVDYPIPNYRLMNVSSLWVAYKKASITSMLVALIHELFMKLKDFLFKFIFKRHNIGSRTLTFFELVPS